MRVFFYMSDHQKLTPEQKREPMNWINANTAFTSQCSPETTITLFRDEEWFKVFMHETFHNLGLDFSAFDNETRLADAAILRHYTVDITDLRLYETYCEMWAEIMNTMFIAHLTTRTTDFETVFRKMEKLLNAERIWSMFQCVKVLQHHQLLYSHVLKHPTIVGVNKPVNKYNEKTNAFCYYVLKSILMFNIDDFVQWVAKNNGRSLQFIETNVISYATLIADHTQSSDYMTMIDNIEKWFAQHSPHNKGFIMNTMRMTVSEMS